MTRDLTVDCADHGEMTRDDPGMGWACAAQGCTARLPDAEAYRLVARAPGYGPGPVPIVVRPVSGTAAPGRAPGAS